MTQAEAIIEAEKLIKNNQFYEARRLLKRFLRVSDGNDEIYHLMGLLDYAIHTSAGALYWLSRSSLQKSRELEKRIQSKSGLKPLEHNWEWR